jgi:predicted RNase H-like HicB family nuclease
MSKVINTLDEFLSLNYEMKITPYSDEDEAGFIVTCPELEGIEVFGETVDEALEELYEAKIAYYEMSEGEKGFQIQYPKSYQKEDDPSGRLTARLPVNLHKKVRNYSYENKVSLNSAIIQLLNDGLMENERNIVLDKVTSLRNELRQNNVQINMSYMSKSDTSIPLQNFIGFEGFEKDAFESVDDQYWTFRRN